MAEITQVNSISLLSNHILTMQKKTTVVRDKAGVVSFESDHVTFDQKYTLGKNLRKEKPLQSHGVWKSSPDRRDVIAILLESNIGRLPELIPIRHRRMLKNPFAFFRGSAAIMASDLSITQQSGITVQLCGDCHLSNFGLYASPERNLIFDLNDFDETHPGPFEWDIKRLVSSFYIGCESRGLSDTDCKNVVEQCLTSYKQAMRKFSTMNTLDIWYSKLGITDLIATSPDAKARNKYELLAKNARKNKGEYLFPKLRKMVNDGLQIIDHPPLLVHASSESQFEEDFVDAFSSYHTSLSPDHRFLLNQFKIQDIALKVVGVGSVGTRCGVILLIGEKSDPLLLQIKEARHSVLEPYTSPSIYENQGERVVQGQRLLQAASDIFLGWASNNSQIFQYYLRQLKDMKYSFDIESLTLPEIFQYSDICGWTLARAHARGGGAAVISGYIGKSDLFEKAYTSFAKDYADQNTQDFKRFVRAVQSGEIVADPNPEV
jgi:uncharacterized protein (DUF2252 family)